MVMSNEALQNRGNEMGIVLLACVFSGMAIAQPVIKTLRAISPGAAGLNSLAKRPTAMRK